MVCDFQNADRFRRTGVKLELLEALDDVAAWMRKRNLTPLTHLGRDVLKGLYGRSLSIECDGLRLFGDIESRGDLLALKRGIYEPYTMSLFKARVKRGMTVLDLGAQIGYFSLLAARQVSPGGRVLAFEPDPRNYATLLRNIRVNHFESIVQAFPKAVSERSGSATFHIARSSRSSSLFHRKDRERDAVCLVDTVTVDAVVRQARVDVIKLDVEGAEPLVLEGASDTVRRNPQLTLFVEVNSAALRSAGISPEQFLDRLRKRFDRIDAIEERSRRLISLMDYEPNEALGPVYNLICEAPRAS